MAGLFSRRTALVRGAGVMVAVPALVMTLAACQPAVTIATPEPAVVAGAGETLPVGARLPSGDSCAVHAHQVGSDREARPENEAANHSVPIHLELPTWPDFWDSSANQLFVPRIDGRFTGTTDEIIAWGSCKWGIGTDVVRAMAVEESFWRQAHVGDHVDDPALCVGGASAPCPTSFGLLQIKHTTRPGSWPYSQQHTAFNVDYSLAVLRACFEGWVSYLRGGLGSTLDGYGPGDLWGCVGWHFSGEWNDDDALAYIDRVRRHLDDRPWTRW